MHLLRLVSLTVLGLAITATNASRPQQFDGKILVPFPIESAGAIALESRGVDWTGIPLNVGFALRLNLPLAQQVTQQEIVRGAEACDADFFAF